MPWFISPRIRTLAFTFIASWLCIFVAVTIYAQSLRHKDASLAGATTQVTKPELPCRQEYFDEDQCRFVITHCTHIDQTGLIPYLEWYYCAGKASRNVLLTALCLWLLVIFASMATAADKFLAVNLASLVHSLKISENLAGVTIFAFGNGSADLFSTLAAMNSGNGSLAVAELFGAAAFITAIVLGAVAVVQPFTVDRKAFLGDVVCFLFCASVNLALISDGQIQLWESFIIIGLYVLFVAFVLIRDRQKAEEVVLTLDEEADLVADAEPGPSQPTETTALLRPPSEEGSHVPAGLERKPSSTSSETVVVEGIPKGDVIDPKLNLDDDIDIASLSDWASDIEQEAEIPPFIQLCEDIRSCQVSSVFSLVGGTLRFPATILMGLTTVTQPEIEHCSDRLSNLSDELALTTTITREPQRHPKEFWMLCLQLILGPQFIGWSFWILFGATNFMALVIAASILACSSLVFLGINRNTLLHPSRPLHVFLSTIGFLTATAWIYLLASEVVAVIESLGVISDISDALLGATVFAIGNSSDDIFADISVAKRGHPVLASAACLGGPMLNSLLGIGFGSLIQVIRGNYQPYVFNVPASLFVSGVSLLTGLAVVLGYVLLRSGRLDKILGYGLMTLWVAFTAVNIYVSMG